MRNLNKVFFLITMLSIFIGCQNQEPIKKLDNQSLDLQKSNDITLDDAKNYFDNVVEQSKSAKSSSKKSYPQWDKAKKVKKSNKEVIIVPILHDAANSLRGYGVAIAWFFKSNGKTESRIVEIIADVDYVKKNKLLL